MCIELQMRYRRCAHTRLLHWTYCPILTPSERQPSTGRACRRYKLRYKESSDATGCFECKVLEIAQWGAVATSPAFSNFPQETSPTMAGFGVTRSPAFSTFERSLTFSILASSAGPSSFGAGDRESKDSEVSVAASDEPLFPGVGNWRASGGSEEIPGKELGVEAKEGGVKGWFKKRFKAREGYDVEAFGFQRMDA